jgi:hypothetical protein
MKRYQTFLYLRAHKLALQVYVHVVNTNETYVLKLTENQALDWQVKIMCRNLLLKLM